MKIVFCLVFIYSTLYISHAQDVEKSPYFSSANNCILDSVKLVEKYNFWKSEIENDRIIYGENSITFQNKLIDILEYFSIQDHHSQVLSFIEPYNKVLSKLYGRNSGKYLNIVKLISYSYMACYPTNEIKNKWVIDFMEVVESELNESSPYFFDLIGCCALIKQTIKQYDEYIILVKRQLLYAKVNNISPLNSKCNLLYGYISNNQIEKGLKIMSSIEDDDKISISEKLLARYQLLLAFFNIGNSDLFIFYTKMHLKSFIENKHNKTQNIIEGYVTITKEFNDIDSIIKIYEGLPNVTLRDIEIIYDKVSTFASINKNSQKAIDYRIKSLKLCDEINDPYLYFYGSQNSLKIEQLGFLYGQIGDCKKNIECSKEGLKQREKLTGKINEEYIKSLNMTSTYINNCLMDYQASLEFHEEALYYTANLYGINSDRYISELSNLAGHYKMANQYDESLKSYQICSDFYKNKYSIKSEKYLENEALIASVYGDMGDYKKSIDMLISIEKKYKKATKSHRTLINNIAASYADLGNNEQSLNWRLKQEQYLKRSENDVAELLRFYSGISNCYMNLNNLEKSEDYFLKGIKLIENLEDSEINSLSLNIITLYNNGTKIYMNNGDYKKADALLSELENFYNEKSIHNPQYNALILKNRGDIYKEMHNFDNALKYYHQAYLTIKDFLPITHPTVTGILNNFSVLCFDAGLIEESLELNRFLLEIREETLGTSHPDYITVLNNMSCLYRDLDSLQQAEKCLNHILEIMPDNPLYLNNAALLYDKLKNYKKAEEFFLNSMKISKETNKKVYIQSLINYAFFCCERKKFEKLLPICEELLQVTKHEINQNFSFLTEKEREEFWTNIRGRLHPIYYMLKKKPGDKVNSLAYNATVFTKGLLLRSSNEIRRTIQYSGNKELNEKFADLQSLRRQIINLQSNTDSNIITHAQRLEIQADSIDKLIVLASSDYRDLNADLTNTWKDIQKQLKPNEVAIEFVDFKEWSDSVMYCALLIRKDSKVPEYIPLFEQSQLSELLNNENPEAIKNIQKLYNSGNPRFYNGRKLYNLIWQPIEKHLNGIETVYYSPAGLLNRISFAAISTDTLSLNAKYNLHLLSSTREILSLKNKEKTFLPLQQAIAYGGIFYDIENPEDLVQETKKFNLKKTQYFASRSLPSDSTRSGWGYLEGTEKEVLEVEYLLKQTNVPNLKFMGISANEESFKNLSGNSPELIHIATHGFFLENEKEIRETGFITKINKKNENDVNPLLRSGLLFAGANRAWKNENVIPDIEDGVLTAEEISQLNLSNTKLVVLSACETALGEVMNSEGVFGLQRAFKLAGVETIVMSLWKVDDITTKDFMIAFYQNLLLGKTKSQSFKSAQQKIKEEHSNPYYWAAFVMMD